MEATATAEVDEKLYSRQLYVMGHEAQRRMMASNALVIGLSGLGVEVAKNCILAGIRGLTLCDPYPPTSYDLGGNFYLSASDTKKNKNDTRAALCRDKLSELNPYVSVTVESGVSIDVLEGKDGIDNSILDPFTCVVVTIPLPDSTLLALNAKCRASGIAFICSRVHSVFGQIFCDFGDEFICVDKDGETPATSQLESLTVCTNDKKEKVLAGKVLEDQGRHGLETGDTIVLARLGNNAFGLEEKVEYQITSTGPFTFELLPSSSSSSVAVVDDLDLVAEEETRAVQGYITQVKKPVKLSFDSYEVALKKTPELLFDFAKFDRPPLLHAAFQALSRYCLEHNNELPQPGDAAAAREVLRTTQELYDDVSEQDERVVLHLASGSRAVLSPVCAAIGGMVGQEVLKACSGKFTPIPGFFYLDADECLPAELLPATEVTPSGTSYSSRYDSQIAVFGKKLQQDLLDLKYFLIGAGAIGCEMLKNWALMGVGCGDNGHVYVTDMDRIEKSNLSRQFLFRNTDINRFKSTCAADAAQNTMNSELNITAYQEKAAPDTEHLFGDEFYDRLDGVCTALDNVEARLYVDQRCLFYRLPLLESGTLGTKGNTQVVVPHLTEHYGATRDPPEKSIPVCTLKNFPNQIQHTLQWARDYFEGEFTQTATEVNSFIEQGPAYFESLQQSSPLETVQSIHRALVQERPESFDDCVVWARLKFEDLFHNQIRQLLHNFPPDQKTSSGTQFWSGSKRCPKALVFDETQKCEDALLTNHLDFVTAAANLRAAMFRIKGSTDPSKVTSVLKNVLVPDFLPCDGIKIAQTDEEAKQESNEQQQQAGGGDNYQMEELMSQLASKPSELAGFTLEPQEFDKDLDAHMAFVTACSNLRALNYQIPTEDVHRSRAIAGRIIPAIATTTALVTGLISLELYKLVQPHCNNKLENFKNGFVNLAVPFMTLSEPMPPAKTKSVLPSQKEEWNWTAWDSLDLPTTMINPTMGELIDYFETKYDGLEINMLSHGVSILFSFFASPIKVKQRKAMKMTDVITSINPRVTFSSTQKYVSLEVIACTKEDDEEVELPYLKLRIR